MLKLTYEELQRQPDWWIERRMIYEMTKSDVQEFEMKRAKAKK